MAYKRILAFVMLVLVILYQFPVMAISKQSDMSEAVTVNECVDESGELLSGGIKIRKLYEKISGINKYKVTTKIDSMPVQNMKSLSIIFLVDTANSDLLEKNVTFLKNYILEMSAADKNIRFAVALLGNTPELKIDFTEISNKDILFQKLDSIEATTGNYLDKGLNICNDALKKERDSNRAIVVLSNGYATYSSKVIGLESVDVMCENAVHSQAKWTIMPVCDSNIVVGNGISMSNGIAANRVNVPATICNAGVSHSYTDRTFPKHHGEISVAEATRIKKTGMDIFSINLAARTETASGVMEKIQNSGYFTSAQSAVDGLNEKYPATNSPAFTDAVLNEKISSAIHILPESIKCVNGEAIFSESSLSWKVSDQSASLEYEVYIDVMAPEFNEDAPISTYLESVFNYDGGSMILNQPNILLDLSKIYIQGILCDGNGNLLSENGEKVSNIENAKIITDKQGYLNSNGENIWQVGSSVVLFPEKLIKSDDYILCSNREYSFTLPETSSSPTVYLYLMERKTNVTVEHIMSGDNEPFDTENLRYNIGDTITEINISENAPSGYKILNVESLPFTVKSTDNIIKVYYSMDENAVIPYTINYYQDGEFIESEYCSVPLAISSITVIPDKNKYDGYNLEKIRFYEQEENEEILVSITVENNIVDVFYLKNTPEIPPEKETMQCEIRYYINNEYKISDYIEVQKDDPVLKLNIDHSKFEGYEYKNTVFKNKNYISDRLELTVSESENIAKVYYYGRPVVKLPFSIEYYVDGVLSKEVRDLTVDKLAPDYAFAPEGKYLGKRLQKVTFGGEGEHTNISNKLIRACITETENVFRAYYEAEQFECKVMYYYDGEPFHALTQYIVVKEGDSVSDKMLHKNIDYTYKKSENFCTPPIGTEITEPCTIRVDYISDQNTVLKYKVNIYQDGRLSETSERTVSTHNPYVIFDENELKNYYLDSEYEFDDILFMNTSTNSGKITLWYNQFNIYYSKQDIEPEKYIHYTVEHYADGELISVKQDKISAEHPYLERIDKLEDTGCDFVKTEPILPAEISEQNNIIKVYYESPEVPPVPIEPDKKELEVQLFVPSEVTGEENSYGISVPVDESIFPWITFEQFIYESASRKLESIIIERSESMKPRKAALGYSAAVLGVSGDLMFLSSTSEDTAEKTIVRQADTYTFKSGFNYKIYFNYVHVEPNDDNNGNTDTSGNALSNVTKTNKTYKPIKSISLQKTDSDINTIPKDITPPSPVYANQDLAGSILEEDKRKGLNLPLTGSSVSMSFRIPIILGIITIFLYLQNKIKDYLK